MLTSSSVLDRVALATLTAIGIVAALAPKGAVVVLIISAVAANRRVLPSHFRLWRSLLGRPFSLSLAAALMWAGIASTFSPSPAESIGLCLRVVALFVVGAVAWAGLASLAVDEPKAFRSAVMAGAVLGLIALLMRAATITIFATDPDGSPGHEPWAALNAGASVLVILFWPAVVVACRERKVSMVALLVSGMAAVLVVVPSGAALAAMGAAAIAFGLSRVTLRLTVECLGVSLAVAIVAAPLVFGHGATVLLRTEVSDSIPQSWQHRLHIWKFVGDRIAEKPLVGWGFDSSRAIPGGKAATAIGGERLPLHPHNAPLQVWLELGLVGAILTTAALLVGFRLSIAATDLAMISSYAVSALVSFGLWQNWWIAVAWLMAGIASAEHPRTNPV